MPMVTDAKFVNDKFDEVFEIDHGKKKSFRDKYRTFHVHQATPSQGGEDPGPIRVATTPDGAKLVTIVFSTQIGADGQEVDQRLREIRLLLAELLEPGERCHLFVEDAQTAEDQAEDVFIREARGYIAPPDSSEAM
jgi:hypothetical protein